MELILLLVVQDRVIDASFPSGADLPNASLSTLCECTRRYVYRLQSSPQLQVPAYRDLRPYQRHPNDSRAHDI